ncbi:hypothetical protein C900_02093 [Fulvivirga imtechensis AK7]|uniref:Lipoprotein n=1 Tax=Fulvivirga imtechensis AK7 TaxID=1237149 RepID=L8K190_9BACT|nr:hypothetical protein [Fulvivirga imtechensis]ELR73689.1 hypothetical protein C900_02093 [Fulvivirga imtechensis AK7]
MKLPLSIFACLLLLCSCGEVREEITFHKDGSGTYDVSANTIPMMRQMMEATVQMTAPEGETMDSVAMAAKVEEMVWKDFPDKIDSVISLESDLTPDMRNDPEVMALFNKTTAYMKGSRQEGFIKTGVKFDFDNSEEFLSFMKMIEDKSQEEEQKNPLGKTKTELIVTPNSYVRTVAYTDRPDNDDESTALARMMLQDMSMLTVLNFPKKIDKVDLVHYKVVERSERSIILKFDMLKALEGDEKSEIRVTLK